MGHIFRLKRAGAVATKTTIVGWSNSTATTYNHGYVDGISDATTTQNEITSILRLCENRIGERSLW